jgi:hypothetical protein
MPFMLGSTTARTPAAATAASIALPPSCSTFRPAADARVWLVAIMPLMPTAGDRVPRMSPAGRSPGMKGNELLTKRAIIGRAPPGSRIPDRFTWCLPSAATSAARTPMPR